MTPDSDARALAFASRPRTSDPLIRRALWVSAIYNASGAVTFAFPAGPLGQLAGLPADVPGIYRALLAMFVLLFGGMYAWLAVQPAVHRPMVGLAAIGKASAFALIVLFCTLGQAPWSAALTALGDGVLALLFASWLRRRT